MSARNRPHLLLASLLIFASPAFSASNSLTKDDAATASARAEKAVAQPPAQGSAKSSAATSRPTESTAGRDGSVTQALTRLYRIPRSSASRQFGRASGSDRYVSQETGAGQAKPRQFSTAGRGEAPRETVSETNRMGYQHADAIRNSVSELPVDDDLRQPENDGHIVENENTGPAIPQDDSMTAHNWGPYPDRDYEQGTARNNEPEDNSRFGFTQQGYGRNDWAERAHARTRAGLATANSEFSRGLAAFRGGDYRIAVKHFKQASDTNRGDPAAMLYSAHALFAIGRYQESATFLRKAFALEPRISMLTYDIRDDYGNKADFNEQVRALNNAIAASPRDLDRLTVLGYVLNYTDQPDRAFDVLSRARAIAPRDNLVKLLYESTHPPDAITGGKK